MDKSQNINAAAEDSNDAVQQFSADHTDQKNGEPQNLQSANAVDQDIIDTSTMEVHHPHHLTHKKKWSEYILEFMMLFFAVFLGFFVENYREHMIEEERTEKHMHTMVENLKYDTARYGSNLRINVVIAKGLDSFRYEIKQALEGNVNPNKLYYHFWKYGRGYGNPIINDAAMSQLKSSGMIRMIKSDSLVNEIGDYYERRATTITGAISSINRTRDEMNETMKSVFSFKEFDEIIEIETTFTAASFKFNEDYISNILTRDPALKLLPTAAPNFERLYNDLVMFQLQLRKFNSFIRYNHQGADSLMLHIKQAYKL